MQIIVNYAKPTVSRKAEMIETNTKEKIITQLRDQSELSIKSRIGTIKNDFSNNSQELVDFSLDEFKVKQISGKTSQPVEFDSIICKDVAQRTSLIEKLTSNDKS